MKFKLKNYAYFILLFVFILNKNTFANGQDTINAIDTLSKENQKGKQDYLTLCVLSIQILVSQFLFVFLLRFSKLDIAEKFVEDIVSNSIETSQNETKSISKEKDDELEIISTTNSEVTTEEETETSTTEAEQTTTTTKKPKTKTTTATTTTISEEETTESSETETEQSTTTKKPKTKATTKKTTTKSSETEETTETTDETTEEVIAEETTTTTTTTAESTESTESTEKTDEETTSTESTSTTEAESTTKGRNTSLPLDNDLLKIVDEFNKEIVEEAPLNKIDVSGYITKHYRMKIEPTSRIDFINITSIESSYDNFEIEMKIEPGNNPISFKECIILVDEEERVNVSDPSHGTCLKSYMQIQKSKFRLIIKQSLLKHTITIKFRIVISGCPQDSKVRYVDYITSKPMPHIYHNSDQECIYRVHNLNSEETMLRASVHEFPNEKNCYSFLKLSSTTNETDLVGKPRAIFETLDSIRVFETGIYEAKPYLLITILNCYENTQPIQVRLSSQKSKKKILNSKL